MESNYVKGSGRGLIDVISRYFPRRSRDRSRIAGVLTDLRSECFLNTILSIYRYANMS
jgi:hypothetical protein